MLDTMETTYDGYREDWAITSLAEKGMKEDSDER